MIRIQSIKKIMFSLLVAVALVSCNNGPSLQTYFVDHQESAHFTTVDVPTSIVSFEGVNLTDAEREAYESIERLNFLGFKSDSSNLETYKSEMAKVKTILNDEKYSELGEFNIQGSKVLVKSLGNDDAADEFVVFANSNDVGFGVLRILGDDMDAEKLFKLAEAMNKAEVDQSQLQGIADFFK